MEEEPARKQRLITHHLINGPKTIHRWFLRKEVPSDGFQDHHKKQVQIEISWPPPCKSRRVPRFQHIAANENAQQTVNLFQSKI